MLVRVGVSEGDDMELVGDIEANEEDDNKIDNTYTDTGCFFFAVSQDE